MHYYSWLTPFESLSKQSLYENYSCQLFWEKTKIPDLTQNEMLLAIIIQKFCLKNKFRKIKKRFFLVAQAASSFALRKSFLPKGNVNFFLFVLCWFAKTIQFFKLGSTDIILSRRKKSIRKIVLPKDEAFYACAYLPFLFFNFKPNFALKINCF